MRKATPTRGRPHGCLDLLRFRSRMLISLAFQLRPHQKRLLPRGQGHVLSPVRSPQRPPVHRRKLLQRSLTTGYVVRWAQPPDLFCLARRVLAQTICF